MKYKKCIAILALLSITTFLPNRSIYASNVDFQQKCIVQETKAKKHNIDVKEVALGAGVAEILEISMGSEVALVLEEIETPKAISPSVAIEKDAIEEKYWGYKNLGLANVDNHLNIRQEPSEEGKLIGKLNKNAACEIITVKDGWAHIKSGKVDGYCSADFLFMGEQAIRKAKEVVSMVAVVNTDTLKVREEPNTKCSVITLIPKDEELDVVEVMDNGWIKFMLDDEEAFVSGEFVKIEERLEKAATLTELLYGQGVSNVRVDLVQYAKQFIGNKYVWGGTSLNNGIDCSGFTMRVYEEYGIKLPHYSVAQSKMGKKVTLAEAQPGDLVFYAKNGTINHVAIYIGGGQVVHASNEKTGIRISSVNYRTPAAIRSFLG